MSMNFYIKGFECWQTPTQITDMIMVDTKGQLLFEKKGREALHAIYIYAEWVKGRLNGSWENKDDLDSIRIQIKYHIEKLNDFLSRTKRRKLVVHQM